MTMMEVANEKKGKKFVGLISFHVVYVFLPLRNFFSFPINFLLSLKDDFYGDLLKTFSKDQE
jgi:hypothetical protein